MTDMFIRLSESDSKSQYLNLISGLTIVVFAVVFLMKISLSKSKENSQQVSDVNFQIQKTLISIPTRPKRILPSYIAIQKKKRELKRFLNVDEELPEVNSPKLALKKVRSLNKRIFAERRLFGYNELFIISEVNGN